MYNFWYHFVKLKHGGKVKLCYMDTDSFIVYVKTDDIYKDIPEDVEARFDIQDSRLWIRLGKYQEVIVLIKDE